MYLYEYICIYIYICIYVFLHICIYIYIYILHLWISNGKANSMRCVQHINLHMNMYTYTPEHISIHISTNLCSVFPVFSDTSRSRIWFRIWFRIWLCEIATGKRRRTSPSCVDLIWTFPFSFSFMFCFLVLFPSFFLGSELVQQRASLAGETKLWIPGCSFSVLLSLSCLSVSLSLSCPLFFFPPNAES